MYNEPYLPEKKELDIFYELDREISDAVINKDPNEMAEGYSSPSTQHKPTDMVDMRDDSIDLYKDQPPIY
ncbi:hypothetical protein [Oceanirhabdus sp. W0125-5]|uniref:hypothetical protein n=1 Tax=Oceanirhabdus sp. W0125-5 TaxID=2999116 RepID=UPI0022F2E332|nr:hypothetical protein [Oceanirhabdus sp. W0125-5]WBW98312.1 hypothetical protein OW730_05955 [Oceanirhabdus sp. W0125-5]